MALLFTDGYDSYASTAGLSDRYETVEDPWAWDFDAGRQGGGAIVSPGSPGSNRILCNVGTVLPTNGGTLHMGFWLRIDSAPAAVVPIIGLIDGNGTRICSLQVNAFGVLQHGTGSGSSLSLLGSRIVTDGDWHWVEFRWSTNGTATWACYVDAILQWSALNQPTATTSRAVAFELIAPIGPMIVFDDVIVYDNSSGYPQTADFPIGPSVITPLRPTADLAVEFLRSTGSTNFDLVNEEALDETNWVQSDVVADQDLYSYEDLTIEPDRIHAAVVTSFLRNPDVGDVDFNNLAFSHATQTTATARTCPIFGQYRQDSFPLDPDTNGQWHQGTINSAAFGIRVAG